MQNIYKIGWGRRTYWFVCCSLIIHRIHTHTRTYTHSGIWLAININHLLDQKCNWNACWKMDCEEMNSRSGKILAAWMSERECLSCISKWIVIISSIGEWECLAFCTGNIHLSSTKCINVFVLLYDCWLAGWLAVLPVRLLLILMMVYLIVWVCFFFLDSPYSILLFPSFSSLSW